MALGDQVVLLVDEGGRAPEKVVVRVGGAGGSVSWSSANGFVKVTELTSGKRIRREEVVREDKLVRLTYEPKV